MEDVSHEKRTFADIEGLKHAPIVFRGNEHRSRFIRDWLGLEKGMLSNRLYELDTNVPATVCASWPRHEVHSSFSFHEMVLRVVHKEYLHDELCCYDFCCIVESTLMREAMNRFRIKGKETEMYMLMR